MPIPSTILASILSWRTLAIVLALLNLKAIPFSWHLRLLYRLCKYWYTPKHVKKALRDAAANGTIHPIFDTVSIFSHAPAYESDYNLHKSNSTYFSDLDESRTALMTKLYGPGLRVGAEQLDKEGYKGRTNIILGSVHTSFHKEIKPYERYEVRSRVLGWDAKWVIIGSFFIRPGKTEGLLASSLSKYVVKKARFTVPPERCFRVAGWLPDKPPDSQAGPDQAAEESNSSDDTVILDDKARATNSSGPPPQSDTGEIVAPVPQAVVETAETVDTLQRVVDGMMAEAGFDVSATSPPRAAEWDWHRIEMERLRGLQIVAGWLALDKGLMDEYSHGKRENGSV